MTLESKVDPRSVRLMARLNQSKIMDRKLTVSIDSETKWVQPTLSTPPEAKTSVVGDIEIFPILIIIITVQHSF